MEHEVMKKDWNTHDRGIRFVKVFLNVQLFVMTVMCFSHLSVCGNNAYAKERVETACMHHVEADFLGKEKTMEQVVADVWTKSQKMSVNLKLVNATIAEVIENVEQQVGKSFFFRKESVNVNKRIDVELKNAAMDEVVMKVFGKEYEYSVIDNMIVIMLKAQSQTKLQSAEERVIEGIVKDVKGMPLPGVTVVIKGTTVGVTTDVDGHFKLLLPEQKSITLVFSFVGMKTLEVVYKDQKKLDVVMEEEVKQVDEVVVTGYFNKAKSSYTGVAKTYSGEELKKVNPVNLLSALAILDPSFKMVENNLDGSNPNVLPEFQIRGASSLPDNSSLRSSFSGNPNMPTFIMDGFEVDVEKVFDLDPNRIESMTILKDAAATAIYGSRASNGVVVINTKQPEPGQLRLQYTMDLSFNIPDLTDYDLLDAKDKLELEKNAGYFDPQGDAVAAEQRKEDYNFRLGLVRKGYNTYWLNKPLRAAVGHKHSVSIEGGEGAMRYSLDLTYENAPGVMKESGRERKGMGVMLLYRFKNLTFRNSLTYDYVKSENSPYGTFRDYARMNPYYPYEDENGKYLKYLERQSFVTGRSDVINPLYNTQLNTLDEENYTEFIENFSLDWYINEAFRLKGTFAITHKKTEETVFKPADHTDFATYGDEDFYRKGYYSAGSAKEFSYDANIVLTFFKQWGNHTFNANAAWNIQDEAGEEYTVRAEGFQDDQLDHISFATQYAEYTLPSGSDYASRLMGMLVNFGYSYRECYLFDFSTRVDGSSQFGANNRWSPFWSVGLGWNMHKEKFAENWRINELKLRGSYGIVGSQAFSPYQSFVMYEYLTDSRYRNNIGAIMLGLGNSNLQWQQTHQLNIGADMAFWNNRIQFSGNFYRNLSKDMLVDVTLPPSLGYTTYRENLGEVENKGYELDLRLTVLRNQDAWFNLILSGVYNKNTLKKISNSLEAWNRAQDESTEDLTSSDATAPKVRYIEGESINTIWGLKSLGINPANGREIFVALDGSLIDTYNVSEIQPIGCTDSKLEGNLGIDGGWKGLQLSVYFRYRLGGQQYNSTLVDRIENADKRYNTDRRVLEKRWTNPGDVTFFKDVKDESYTQPTSRFVVDYNYLQLTSLNLSYDFPTKLIKRAGMENLRLSFSMNDLFHASSVKQERGLDYPFARAFRTSLRITF